jgi:hypothetical protein
MISEPDWLAGTAAGAPVERACSVVVMEADNGGAAG